MKKSRYYLAFILLCVGIIIYFWESPESLLERFADKTKTGKNPPYAIVHFASSKHFDNHGELDYSFEADTIKYFREEIKAEGKVSLQNYTEIEQPRLIIFHEGHPWLLEALHGKFTEDNQHLLLWQNVVVTNMADNDKQTMMETEKLEIKPEEKYAYTQEPVKISTPAGVVSAKGMIANFTEKQITLLSEVQGTHDPLL